MREKIALVTGGTSGIGRKIVEELLEKGCTVITCYSKTEENAKKLQEEIHVSNYKRKVWAYRLFSE